MKLTFVLLTFCGVAFAGVVVDDAWKQVKSPLDSPRYQLIMSKLFPPNAVERTFPPNRGGRIIGGELAKPGQFVYQALLLNIDSLGDTYVCGGSIISHNWILTAAHCLDDIVKTSVYVGIVDRINGPAVWKLDVTSKSNMITHESFNSVNLWNDIALVRLVSTIINHPDVGIVSLPSRSEVSVNLEGRLATIAGFGRTSDTSGPSQFLRYIQVPIVANSVCEKVFGVTNVRDTNLCLDTSSGKSSCQGDSGGGLTTDLNGRKVVVGVVSYGAAVGCTLGHPAVFTRVTKYLDWIQTKTSIQIT